MTSRSARRWSATVIRGRCTYPRLYYAVCMCIVYVRIMTMSLYVSLRRGSCCAVVVVVFSGMLFQRPESLTDVLFSSRRVPSTLLDCSPHLARGTCFGGMG